MKEERIKKLEKALKYLVKEERDKEILRYDQLLNDNNVDLNKIVKDIYLSRGIDYSKLKGNFFENLMDAINDLRKVFVNKDAKTKQKMIVEIIYMVILLILIKLPFDLVRDVGYDYINILSTNNILKTVWELLFLLLYTITLLCTFIVLVRNFNKKYNSQNI